MARASDLLALARGELGVGESPAGSNCVKYNTAYYGREVRDTAGTKYPWCVVFLWWLFREAGAPELFYGGGRTASCGTLMGYAKTHGLFVSGGYVPGDLVFLRFSAKQAAPEHIGIVRDVRADGALVTIEGNTSPENDANGGQVRQRVRPAWQAVGGYRPAYEEDEDMDQAAFNKLADKWLESRAALAPSIQTEEGEAARAWAEEQGILLGDGQGRKQYRSFCTREQAVLFLYRLAEKLRG
ncbi:MAG: CHAP domain-containing protein [Oscillospiraceae bacterium]|nr:CHAP domain-containing protein [Oscillospiraceae bacterium]